MALPCLVWDNDNESPEFVVTGLAAFQKFTSRNAKSHILAYGDLKTWHENIFRKVVPVPYYAGHFRCDDPKYPCLNTNIQVNGALGAPFGDVQRLMRDLSEEIRTLTGKTDAYISKKPTPSDRTRASIQLAALYSGRIIQIHPFLNGNGRISRCVSNYVLARYGYPPIYFDPLPRPGPSYVSAAAASMTGNFRPLYDYLLATLAA